MRTDGLGVLVETIAIFVMVYAPLVRLSMAHVQHAFQTLLVHQIANVVQTSLILQTSMNV
jgi:hypothetical protein